MRIGRARSAMVDSVREDREQNPNQMPVQQLGSIFDDRRSGLPSPFGASYFERRAYPGSFSNEDNPWWLKVDYLDVKFTP